VLRTLRLVGADAPPVVGSHGLRVLGVACGHWMRLAGCWFSWAEWWESCRWFGKRAKWLLVSRRWRASGCWFSWAEGVGGCLWALDEAGGLLVFMGGVMGKLPMVWETGEVVVGWSVPRRGSPVTGP